MPPHRRRRCNPTGSSKSLPSSTPVQGDRPDESKNLDCRCLGRCFPSVSRGRLNWSNLPSGRTKGAVKSDQSFPQSSPPPTQGSGKGSVSALEASMWRNRRISDYSHLLLVRQWGAPMGGADSMRHGDRPPRWVSTDFGRSMRPFINWIPRYHKLLGLWGSGSPLPNFLSQNIFALQAKSRRDSLHGGRFALGVHLFNWVKRHWPELRRMEIFPPKVSALAVGAGGPFAFAVNWKWSLSKDCQKKSSSKRSIKLPHWEQRVMWSLRPARLKSQLPQYKHW